MRWFSYIVMTALLAWIVGYWLPWWSVAVLTFVTALVAAQSGKTAFWGSALAVFITWFVQALWIDWYTDFILSPRIAELFFLPDPWLLWILTGLMGAIAGGFGGLSGYYGRLVFSEPKEKTYGM